MKQDENKINDIAESGSGIPSKETTKEEILQNRIGKKKKREQRRMWLNR